MLVVFGLSLCVCCGVWLVFVGGLGGIATIGAALRRVAGVSGVYGCKIPRGCLEGPASRALSVAVLVVFDMSLCVCRGGVACFCWWLGGNCYHRRCVAACRRRVGGLWSQNPPWLLGRASIACPFGGCVGRVRHVFVCLSWWCGVRRFLRGGG